MDNHNPFALGAPIRRPIAGLPEFCMRIQDSIRNTVAFVGFADAAPGSAGIECIGNVFFLEYENEGYLVTAKHVAKELDGVPFLLRLNKTDNIGSENIHIDGLKWSYHTDLNIDAAVLPFNVRTRDFYASYLIQSMILTESKIEEEYIGIGSQCYIVGLFRVLAGQKRNLPIVHSGNIALIPGDEKVPVTDWDDPNRGRTRYVTSYLVEAHSLDGLSGSPVFVRPSVDFEVVIPPGRRVVARSPRNEVYLLGLWQAAWNAPPTEVLGVAGRGKVIVPVGMGVVVPVMQIVDILKKPELADLRVEERDRNVTKASQ